MAYKTLRNEALSNVTRLITATYHGKDWSAPDGFIALAHNLYAGYRKRADQTVPDQKPILDKLIDEVTGYKKVTSIRKRHPKEEDDHEAYTIKVSASDQSAIVQAKYLDLVKNIWPESFARKVAGDPHAPIRFYDGGELVGVVMPLRK